MESAMGIPSEGTADPSSVVDALIREAGGDPTGFDGRLVAEMIATSLKLLREGHDTGQLKLINSALKEMRYAYRVFNRYSDRRKVSIFGSARTPPGHPDYVAARDFGQRIAREGWMSITGAGDGIMRAGHEGTQRESSFGLSIRLPFENNANQVIVGDEKLINFRYFFTRKLMFMSHSDAFVICPGGYGTQDEAFESLVLIQTGKSSIVPIVLLEGENGTYWETWRRFIIDELLHPKWISPEDVDLFYVARDPADAVEHIRRFYGAYHSSRYVGERLVIRLRREAPPALLVRLTEEFRPLLKEGGIESSRALEGETDHLELPRLVLTHNRRHFGLVRRLIDRINDEMGAGLA